MRGDPRAVADHDRPDPPRRAEHPDCGEVADDRVRPEGQIGVSDDEHAGADARPRPDPQRARHRLQAAAVAEGAVVAELDPRAGRDPHLGVVAHPHPRADPQPPAVAQPQPRQPHPAETRGLGDDHIGVHISACWLIPGGARADKGRVELATAAKRRKRKKKKSRCTPAKRKPLAKKKKAKRSSAEAEATAAARKKRRRKKRPVCKPKKKRKPGSGTHPAATRPATPPAPGPAAPVPPAPPAPTLAVINSPIAVYSGPFGAAQAERLLWRAGFGPRPGQAAEVAKLGLEKAVLALTRPTGTAPMDGPTPNDDGAPLEPYDRWGHDLLFWLDRMVRSRHQLIERLSLVFHDWFATSNDAVGSSRFMLDQTNLFRAHGLRNFKVMVRAITQDPAMILFLDQASNRKHQINENYARELMELFTLGADRGAYTEDDVRELARSLSGWDYDWNGTLGAHNFHWDEQDRWDPGFKTVFGQRGRWTWEDGCRMVVDHRLHPSFFVSKLWSYFIPTAPDAGTAAKLEALYKGSGYEIRPVLEAILTSKALYEGPRMVKPPTVFVAGMLRARKRGITTNAWSWVLPGAGQRLYYPPDVAGWDDKRWLDTNTTLGRWEAVVYALEDDTEEPGSDDYPEETAAQALAKARAFWGNPLLTSAGVAALDSFSRAAIPANAAPWLRAQRQNALRQLIAGSPDYQTA